MCDGVEKKPVVVEVSGERPITDLAFHLPHQIGAGSESADLAAHGSVERFVEIESGAQSDIGSEPVIVSREGLVQLLVDSKRDVVRNLCFGSVNHPMNSGATCSSFQMQCIYPCAQSRFFPPNKIPNNPGNIFRNARAQWADWNVWVTLVAV